MASTTIIAERVRIDVRDGIADVRLDRPDKLNALDRAMFDALLQAGETLTGLAGLRAVVLSGEGRAFCAGLDLSSFADAGRTLGDLGARTHGAANLPQQVCLQWRQLAVPVIAAITGVAFGGGLQIALGADLRLASPDARLSVMEIRWGLVPDMAGLPLLRRLVRDDVLRDLVYTGRIVEAAEALQLGLVTRVVPEPREAALAAARAIAERSPDAIRAAKRLLDLGDEGGLARALLAESREQAALIGKPNQREAVAAGEARRAPRFT